MGKTFKIDKSTKTVLVVEPRTNESGQIQIGWSQGQIGPEDDLSGYDEETKAACLEARGENDQGDDEQ